MLEFCDRRRAAPIVSKDLRIYGSSQRQTLRAGWIAGGADCRDQGGSYPKGRNPLLRPTLPDRQSIRGFLPGQMSKL